MAIDESGLTKGQLRKLNALRKSVGGALGDEVFSKWAAQQEKASAARRADPVAQKIAEALQRLAVTLNELGPEGAAMTVGEMDGFVTGLLVCAQIVPPSEWLPVVWGPETEFESIEEAEATVAALIGHYNGVARTLAYEPENYGPVLEVDEITDEVFWIEWIRGFESAMGLRPETWEQIKRNDEQDVTEAVEVIHTLYAAANGTSELAEKGLDLLVSMAPTLIGGMVRDLDARKHSRGPGAGERLVPGLPGATGEKAGRDEPCGCGSERRYDRCCGVH